MNPGDQLAGRYELTELIGAGGMGEVWRGKQSALGREVAIKVLHANLQGTQRGHSSPSSGSGAEQRFRREAELVAKVEHRNVVDVIDFGTSEHIQFLVMPLLVGETLGQRLGRTPAPSLLEVVSLMRAVLSGLGAIHDAGIVHRDLKPANVFLVRDADGVVPKLLDFGISREERNAPNAPALTQEGIMMGTPQYMAPEQFESARSVDARADVFSAGAILYEALAGKPPYDGADPFSVYRKILAGAGERLDQLRTDLPPALCELVHRALATSPDQRFASARAMREALDAVVASGSLGGVSAADFPAIERGKVRDAVSGAPTAVAPATNTPADAPGVSAPVQSSPVLRAAPNAPSDRKWGFVAAGVASALMVAGTLFLFLGRGDVAPTPLPPTVTSSDPQPLPQAVPAADGWMRLASSESVEPLAIRWARLPAPDRALDLGFARVGGEWGIFTQDLSASEQTRLATALSGEVSPVAAEESPAHVLVPRFMTTTVRLNIRERAERESQTLRVVPHDTMVVALHGEMEGSSSAVEGEGAMSFLVSSPDASGWGFSHFLEESRQCLPLPGPLVTGGMGNRRALRRSFTAAETHVVMGGTRRDAFLVSAVDEEAGRSVVALFEQRGCRLGDALIRQELDGVVDEHFLSESEGGTLLLVSWYPGQDPPADGRRQWAGWSLESERRVWTFSGRTGMTVAEEERGTVSGTRDRLLARREGYVLSTREAGRSRIWYRYEGGRVVEAEAPSRR